MADVGVAHLTEMAPSAAPQKSTTQVWDNVTAHLETWDGSNLQTLGADSDTNHEAVNPSRSWFEESVSWGLVLVPKTIRSTSL
jgi:hypothetical protein